MMEDFKLEDFKMEFEYGLCVFNPMEIEYLPTQVIPVNKNNLNSTPQKDAGMLNMEEKHRVNMSRIKYMDSLIKLGVKSKHLDRLCGLKTKNK